MNASSLFDLKAELTKKKAEFNKAKLKSGNSFEHARKIDKKKSVWDAKNKGVSQRSMKDAEARAEEENSLAKSRSALAAKALLYDKLSKGTASLADDQKQLFLVNFHQKTSENSKIEEEDQNMSLPSDQQWVEYVDDLGRSRTCMRKDLPEGAKVEPDSENNEEDPLKAHLLSEDMRREQQRLKWEEEEREAMNNPVTDIHYQNVLHDEVRNHGVAYYAFSKDQASRGEQMDRLNELRNQTIKQQSSREKLLQKRKKLMEDRLAKVRQRKNLKEEEPVETVAEVKDESEELKQQDIERKMKEIEEEHKRKAHVRPWDQHKGRASCSIPKLSQEDWVEKKRTERNWEFAPLQASKAHSQPENIETNTERNWEFPPPHDFREHSQPENVETSAQRSEERLASQQVSYANFNLDDIPLPDASTPTCADDIPLPDISGPSCADDDHHTQIMPGHISNEDAVVDNNDDDDEQPTAEKFQADLAATLAYFKNKS